MFSIFLSIHTLRSIVPRRIQILDDLGQSFSHFFNPSIQRTTEASTIHRYVLALLCSNLATSWGCGDGRQSLPSESSQPSIGGRPDRDNPVWWALIQWEGCVNCSGSWSRHTQQSELPGKEGTLMTSLEGQRRGHRCALSRQKNTCCLALWCSD